MTNSSSAFCPDAKVMIVTPSAQVAFIVEVADTVWSRARGLMHHSAIDERSGMLFLYKNEEQVSFWMKNVSFPLDIIFVNQAGVIIKIYEDATPFDPTPIPSGGAVLSVLEIQGGASKRAQISLGDSVRLVCEPN
jgi:uncharacterized membrane protein (UPF0127 family)